MAAAALAREPGHGDIIDRDLAMELPRAKEAALKALLAERPGVQSRSDASQRQLARRAAEAQERRTAVARADVEECERCVRALHAQRGADATPPPRDDKEQVLAAEIALLGIVAQLERARRSSAAAADEERSALKAAEEIAASVAQARIAREHLLGFARHIEQERFARGIASEDFAPIAEQLFAVDASERAQQRRAAELQACAQYLRDRRCAFDAQVVELERAAADARAVAETSQRRREALLAEAAARASMQTRELEGVERALRMARAREQREAADLERRREEVARLGEGTYDERLFGCW